MAVTCISGRGADIVDALLAHVRERAAAHPWDRHVVVVPDQRAADVLALRVAEAGGAFGLDILSLRALGGRLAGPAAAEPLGQAARLALMHEAASRALGPRATLPLCAGLVDLSDRLQASAVPVALRRDHVPAPLATALRAFEAASSGHPAPAAMLGMAARAVAAGDANLPHHLDLWGFLGLGPAEGRLVAALARRVDLHAYVALPAAGEAAGGAARARLWAALEQASAAALAPGAADGAEATARRMAVPNAAAEADTAARVAALWALGVVAPHRIAVLGPTEGLERVGVRLAALGLAVRRPPARLVETAVGAAARQLIEAWADDDRERLLVLLTGPLDAGEADAGARLASRLAEPTGLSARARLRSLADDPDEAAAEMAILVRRCLERLDDASSWQGWADALAEALVDLLGEAASTGPDGEAALVAIARVGALDRLPWPPALEARLAVACTLAELEAAAPEPTLRAAPIELLAFEQAACSAADAVILLGMAAEDLGGAAQDPSPLSDESRAALAASGHALDGPEEALRARLLGAAVALAGARRAAAVYVALGQTGPRPPHPLVAAAPEEAPPALPLDVLDSRRALLRGRRVSAEAVAVLSAGDGLLAGPARWLAAARAPGLTAYDGQVEPGAPVPTVGFTPSVLETYGRCPYVDFLSRLLGLDEQGEADVLDDVEPGLDVLGRIAHAALEHLRRQARSDGREPLSAKDLTWARSVLAEGLAQAFAAEPQSLLGPVHRIALEIDLGHAVALEVAMGDLLTLDSEWRFGPEGATGLQIALPDGRAIALRGRVDRVARTPSGADRDRLWVIDYKTGQSPRPGIERETLQLPLYMLAVAEAQHRDVHGVSGRYASVTSRGGFRLRVLDGGVVAAQGERLADVLGEIVGGMEAGDFHPRPGPCRTCRFRPVCPADIAERAARKGAAGPTAASAGKLGRA